MNTIVTGYNDTVTKQQSRIQEEVMICIKKKMVAPILITVFIVLYYIGFASIIIFIEGIPLVVKLLGGVIPLLFAGVCIYVLIERIKEIRSGEEDDLSKY